MMRVVIADDESNIVELIKRFCEIPLVEVVGEAGNGADAIRLLKSTRPDVLITDVRMPGMNGIDLIEQVRKEFPDINIIVISGYRVFEYVRSAMKFGVQDFLLKPIDREELRKILEGIIETRNAKEQQAKFIENIENNLMESLIRLRQEWLLKVVRLRILDEQLMAAGLFVNISDNHFCIAIFKADYRTDMKDSEPYIVDLPQKIGENIHHILQNNGLNDLFVCDDTLIYFLISFSETDLKLVRKKTEGYIPPLSEYINTENYKYSFYKFHIGIGEWVTSIYDIIQSCNTAIRVIENRMDPSLNAVTSFNRIKEIEEQACKYSFVPQDQDKFALLAESLDRCALTEFFNQTLDKYIQETGSYGWIYNFAHEVVHILKYILIAKGMIDQEAYPVDCDINYFIDKSHNTEILKDRMGMYITSVVKKVSEFKENNISRPIRLAQEYVARKYAEQITLQDVANSVFLSANYFSTLFKTQTGVTFLDYLTKVRMENAKTMLRTSLMNVSEIAYAVGYTDEKYFSKLFNKMIGVKPTEYRKFHS
jgi:two-component system response regulator YesN